MSDTPRTDAQCYDCTYRGDMGDEFTASAGKHDPYGDHVSADFARQLERELNASKQAPTDNDTWNSLLESRAKLERELKAATVKGENITHQLGVAMMQLHESHAREAQLRAALQALYDLGSLELPHRRDPALRAAFEALTLPAPPVVPVEGEAACGGD